MPGESFDYVEKVPSIDGVAARHAPLGTYDAAGSAARLAGFEMVREDLGDASYRILHAPDTALAGTVTDVPAHGYIVLGDNRDDSRDSRYWGPVPDDAIVAKVVRIYLNWEWGEGIDTSRIGAAIE